MPEAKEVTIKLDINEAKECLKYLPENLEGVRSKIEKAIRHVKFWNLMRKCKHLEAVRADFHLTGPLNPQAWSLYCKHPENKTRKEKPYLKDLPEEVRSALQIHAEAYGIMNLLIH